jgi:DNA-binding NarL/FixJ family response regulator
MATMRIMIVARPSLMRNSLLAFLRAMPQVDIIALADDAVTALQTAQLRQPEVVVVDMDLEDGALDLIRQLHHEPPSPRSVVLVNNFYQQKRFLEAGASIALLKGFLEEQLQKALLNEAPANSSGYSMIDREQILRIVSNL